MRCTLIFNERYIKRITLADYIDSILASKMLEVCSTTLPQYVIPKIYDSIEFQKSLEFRIEKYKKRAEEAEKLFKDCKYVSVVKPKWAFYLSVVFNLDNIKQDFDFDIEIAQIKKIILNKIWNNSRFDRKFCYYLLAIKGICIVPLSSFNSTYDWFRITLLEDDFKKYKYTLNEIKKFIEDIWK